MRRWTGAGRATPPVVALTAGVIALAGCGSASDAPGASATDDDPGRPLVRIVESGEELVAHGILMQTQPGRVEICVGAVAESYPPQCGGPVLLGDFSWEDVTPERSGTTTWTTDPLYAVGTYDPDDGEDPSFTLTQAVSVDPPPGYAVPSPQEPGFPQLCEDPYRDGVDGPPEQAEQDALGAALEELDGYVTSWVSDGSHLYNVVVTGEADDAHGRLREVWSGGLCVVQRDLPTQEQLRAAQEALSARFEELRLISSGSGGVTGLLDVEVVMTDQPTVDAVLQTVSPWLTPEQVVITGALRALEPGATSS